MDVSNRLYEVYFGTTLNIYMIRSENGIVNNYFEYLSYKYRMADIHVHQCFFAYINQSHTLHNWKYKAQKMVNTRFPFSDFPTGCSAEAIHDGSVPSVHALSEWRNSGHSLSSGTHQKGKSTFLSQTLVSFSSTLYFCFIHSLRSSQFISPGSLKVFILYVYSLFTPSFICPLYK